MNSLPVFKLPFRAAKNVVVFFFCKSSLVGLIPRMQLGMRLSTTIKALSISVGNTETVILVSKTDLARSPPLVASFPGSPQSDKSLVGGLGMRLHIPW